jgi:hypothetical protein
MLWMAKLEKQHCLSESHRLQVTAAWSSPAGSCVMEWFHRCIWKLLLFAFVYHCSWGPLMPSDSARIGSPGTGEIPLLFSMIPKGHLGAWIVDQGFLQGGSIPLLVIQGGYPPSTWVFWKFFFCFFKWNFKAFSSRMKQFRVSKTHQKGYFSPPINFFLAETLWAIHPPLDRLW